MERLQSHQKHGLCCETWGGNLANHVCNYASAALGVIQRQGGGKPSHVEGGYLCVQRLHEGQVFRFAKVPGKSSPAYLGT